MAFHWSDQSWQDHFVVSDICFRRLWNGEVDTDYGHIKKDVWVSPAWDSGQECPPFNKKEEEVSLPCTPSIPRMCKYGFMMTREAADTLRLCGKWSERCSVVSDSLRPHGQSMEFSRPEHWSGLPFPSPDYVGEDVKIQETSMGCRISPKPPPTPSLKVNSKYLKHSSHCYTGFLLLLLLLSRFSRVQLCATP